MPIRAGRTSREYSHRSRDRSSSKARCRGAGKQILNRCVGAELAYRVELPIKKSDCLSYGSYYSYRHMHRFYISPENWNLGALALTGPEAHHARDVLRIRCGEKIVLFNGQGREITAEITDVSGEEVRLRMLHEAKTPPLQCRIVLGQAIAKGKNMELIVQKAVEIGAAEIAPIISDRTIVQVNSEVAMQKQSRWQQIAIEAAKQCGQNWLPRVYVSRKLAEFFEGVETDLPPASLRLI